MALALSGGLDSVVLFDLLLALRLSQGFEFSAIHVHHGLSPNADQWESFCHQLCRRHAVPFQAKRVEISRRPRQSLEALAREARYQAFVHSGHEVIFLAQHADDQAETFFLQLLRGAGPKGLGAMPEERIMPEAGVRLLRPLLDIPRSLLEAYAVQHQLEWVEDESNRDPAYDRNFLRHEILPRLEQRFPGYRQTLGRACRHLAEAGDLLEELAALDAESAVKGEFLDVRILQTLSPARAANLLRHYLSQRRIPLPDTERLHEALRQLREAKEDAQVRIRFGEFEIRRYRWRAVAQKVELELPPDWSCAWRGEEKLDLPGVRLSFERRKGQGISLAMLENQELTLRFRTGGERFQPSCARPSRSLKNLLQESGVPPWRRARLPLLFCREKLLWVPEVGVDCAYQAGDSEIGLVPAAHFHP
ncbi:MAG: tRNA lysidine(34) synthetase TilS [Sulfuricellaceae bacterium]|jgi:tRNA(Ile)-lysidine synthase